MGKLVEGTMLGWFVIASTAWGADPEAPSAVPLPVPEAEAALRVELESLRASMEALAQAQQIAAGSAAATSVELEALSALVADGLILLDDRVPTEDRVAAADRVALSDDPRAFAWLRAAAGDRDPDVQLACAVAALRTPDPSAHETAGLVAADPFAPREIRTAVIEALGEHDTDGAARVLWQVASERSAPARVRSAAVDALERYYPSQLASLGRPSVVDPIGGGSFVLASGLAGGVLLSSVGVWGQFDGGSVIGAVGGSAIGLGAGTLVAVGDPLTAGEGLAFASGVSWGLASGALATTTTYGGWRWLAFEDRERAVDGGAGFRAAGVLGGGAIGLWGKSRSLGAWDVLEVDTAAYLGSAIVLGGAGLAFYRPPLLSTTGSGSFTGTPPTRTISTSGSFTRSGSFVSPSLEHGRTSSQWLAGATLLGAGVGFGAGAVLAEPWELGWEDALFAVVAGGEGAWIGTFLPRALDIDDANLKGTIRLPWHAFAAGGLLLAELEPVPFSRSVATGWGVLGGNALGAGIPLVLGYDDARSVAQWMVPLGAAGMVGGFVAHPYVAPTGGDASMIGVATLVGSFQATLIGAALDDQQVWVDDHQIEGLALVTGGGVALASYGAAYWLEPRADAMVTLGTAAAWGAAYGLLTPVAVGVDEDRTALYLSTSVSSAVFTAGVGLALLPSVGLEPRSTVVPQLGGATGGTSGALLVSLFSQEAQDVAGGALVGSLVGFGGGAAIEALSPRHPRAGGAARLRLPGHWMPSMATHLGPDGAPVPLATVVGRGW